MQSLGLFDTSHDFHLNFIKLPLELGEELGNLNSDVLRHDLWLNGGKQFLDILEFFVVGLETIVNVTSFHCDELWVFVLAIVNALLATEVPSLIVEGNERLTTMFLACHFIVNDLSSFLNESICKLFCENAFLVYVAHEGPFELTCGVNAFSTRVICVVVVVV